MRNQKAIIKEIRGLLDELDGNTTTKKPLNQPISKKGVNASVPKGALGAINLLIDEEFFNTPKERSMIMDKLKEMGHYHKTTAISMNLLNLTKRRIFNRFKNKDTKNWEYVIRK